MPNHDIGMFVALATSNPDTNKEEFIGFCSVNGHPNDSFTKPEFITASTFGCIAISLTKRDSQALVGACEEWALKCEHKTICKKSWAHSKIKASSWFVIKSQNGPMPTQPVF